MSLKETSCSYLEKIRCIGLFNISITDTAQWPWARGPVTPADLQDSTCSSHLTLPDPRRWVAGWTWRRRSRYKYIN